jgi:hypothetical protein
MSQKKNLRQKAGEPELNLILWPFVSEIADAPPSLRTMMIQCHRLLREYQASCSDTIVTLRRPRKQVYIGKIGEELVVNTFSLGLNGRISRLFQGFPVSLHEAYTD